MATAYRGPAGQGGREGPNGRESRVPDLETHCTRSPRMWRSSRRTVGVKPRGDCEAVKGDGDEGEARLRAAKPINRPNRRMRSRTSGAVG